MDEQDAVSNTEPAAAPPVDTEAVPPESAATAPGPAPRKRRAWVWIVAAAVILALAGGGYASYTYAQAQALAKAQATAALDAEAHWVEAAKSLATIKGVSEAVTKTDPDYAARDMPGLADSLEKMKTSATKELDAADKAVALLPEGNAKSEYAQAIKNARDAVAKSQDAVPVLRAAPAFYAMGREVETALVRARDRVDAGVNSSNAEKFDRAITSANQALADCAAAEKTLKKMKAGLATQTVVTDAGIAQALKLVALERAQARAVIDAAHAWKSYSESRYKAAIARYNKAGDGLNAAPTPTFFDDPSAFASKAVDTLQSANGLLNAANTYHEKALRSSLARP